MGILNTLLLSLHAANVSSVQANNSNHYMTTASDLSKKNFSEFGEVIPKGWSKEDFNKYTMRKFCYADESAVLFFFRNKGWKSNFRYNIWDNVV